MRTHWISFNGLAMLAAAVLGLSQSAQAISINVGMTDPLSVGQVVNHIVGGSFTSRTVAEVNAVIPLAPGTSAPWNGEVATRSLNVFASLPTATETGAWIYTDEGGLVNVGNTVELIVPASGFTYLVAAYDGEHGGVEIFNISSIAPGTQIVLPRYAEPINGTLVSSTKYQMTGWALLNPGESVSDGGATLALLGLSLVGLGWVRRRKQ